MGRAKALMIGTDGVPWVARGAGYLRAAGADPVVVALGAEAERASAMVPDWSDRLVVGSWDEGLGVSLRESLIALASLPQDVSAVLVTLVDLPSAREEAAQRVIGAGWTKDDLRRAVYGGKPGHPVLVGRSHWALLARGLEGDSGARSYLESHGAVSVDCTDIGGGEDVDSLSVLYGRAPIAHAPARAGVVRPPRNLVVDRQCLGL